MDFSKLTTELRKELDKRSVSWTDLTDFYDTDQYVKYIERTVVNPVDDLDRVPARACIFSYGWIMDCKTKQKYPTKGYPDKIDVWCPEYYKEPTGVSLDDILELVERRTNGQSL